MAEVHTVGVARGHHVGTIVHQQQSVHHLEHRPHAVAQLGEAARRQRGLAQLHGAHTAGDRGAHQRFDPGCVAAAVGDQQQAQRRAPFRWHPQLRRCSTTAVCYVHAVIMAPRVGVGTPDRSNARVPVPIAAPDRIANGRCGEDGASLGRLYHPAQ